MVEFPPFQSPFDKPKEETKQVAFEMPVKVISAETYEFINQTLTQCLVWLKKDAPFSHSRSNIRLVDMNVRNSLSMLHSDNEKLNK